MSASMDASDGTEINSCSDEVSRRDIARKALAVLVRLESRGNVFMSILGQKPH